MKKLLVLFTALFLATAMFTLTACGSDDESGIADELIGTWIWELDSNFEFVFEADGSGVWGGSLFEWEVVDDELRMTLEVDHTGLGVHRWTPVIDGDELTITSLQRNEVYTYIRQ